MCIRDRPYAIAVAILSIVIGYIPVALGLSIWIVLPLSMIITALFLYFVGKPVEEKEDSKENLA